jgi:carbamoyltransferase
MTFVPKVRLEKQHLLPAITPVDGTVRFQAHRKEYHPQRQTLITACAKETGIPMVFNTAFNRAGESLAETPLDAAACALHSSTDFMVVDGKSYQPSNSDSLPRQMPERMTP